MSCPGLEVLLRYVDGSADAATSEHVAACDACRKAAAVLESSRTALSGLVGALPDFDAPSPPPRLGAYRVLAHIRDFDGGEVLRVVHDRLEEDAEIHIANQATPRSERSEIASRASSAAEPSVLGVDFREGRPYVVIRPGNPEANALLARHILFGADR